jgi:hypothetical protein
MSDVDRKFSNGSDWDNSIDWDDASDGSEGGYDRHGNFITANAMMEIVKLRVEVDKALTDLAAAEREFQRYIKELDKRTERAEAAQAELAATRAALQYARNLIGPDEIIDAALKGEGPWGR